MRTGISVSEPGTAWYWKVDVSARMSTSKGKKRRTEKLNE